MCAYNEPRIVDFGDGGVWGGEGGGGREAFRYAKWMEIRIWIGTE